jgi:hypothetical protein
LDTGPGNPFLKFVQTSTQTSLVYTFIQTRFMFSTAERKRPSKKNDLIVNRRKLQEFGIA